MWKRIQALRTLTVITWVLVAVPAVLSAGEAAKVGTLHPDGRLEIFVDRFSPTISTGPTTTVAVRETFASISNGFLRIVRVGTDGCTVEEFSAFTRSSALGPFNSVASHLPEGEYVPVTSFPITVGPAEFRDLWVTLSMITTCENVDCGSGEDPAFCELFLGNGELDCHCVGAPDMEESEKGTVQRSQPEDNWPPRPGLAPWEI